MGPGAVEVAAQRDGQGETSVCAGVEQVGHLQRQGHVSVDLQLAGHECGHGFLTPFGDVKPQVARRRESGVGVGDAAGDELSPPIFESLSDGLCKRWSPIEGD